MSIESDANLRASLAETTIFRKKKFRKERFSLRKPADRRALALTVFLMIITAIFMVPVYYLVVTTLKTGAEAAAAPMALPKTLDFSAYVKAFHKMHYPRALWNTFYIAFLTVFLNIVLSSMASYSLARRPNKFNRFVFMIFVGGMMVPFQMGLASLFSLMSKLHLVNTPYSVILINASGSLISSIFLMKSFVSSAVPLEIEEAGRIDGCSVFGIFFKIVLPLMKPVIATMSIIVMLGSWNDFLNPLLFLPSPSKAVLLQELKTNIGQFSVDWASMFPMLVLAVMPLTLIYLFLQRYIIAGVAAGSVKG